jgi:hypothetical protein
MKLKVGDRIRITGLCSYHTPSFEGTLPRETKQVWLKLAKRNRPVKIYKIDEYGQPWYRCKFRHKKYGWVYHELSVSIGEDNWVLVKDRVVERQTRRS